MREKWRKSEERCSRAGDVNERDIRRYHDAYDVAVQKAGCLQRSIEGSEKERPDVSLPRHNHGAVCKGGQWVKKGDLIATLDKRERQRNLEKAEHDLFKADVDLTDKLIGLGFGEDRSEVPEELLKRAEVTSGYYDARFRAEEAQEALENCDLVAPFSGRVANIEAQAHQRNEKVCTLIDDSAFDVEFKVLEDELINIKKGQSVKISPFIDEESTFQGTVAAINPQVDEKGLVKITATLAGGFQSLIDGMNVRVVAEEHLGKMYVVPKDAVVERDGYHVHISLSRRACRLDLRRRGAFQHQFIRHHRLQAQRDYHRGGRHSHHFWQPQPRRRNRSETPLNTTTMLKSLINRP